MKETDGKSSDGFLEIFKGIVHPKIKMSCHHLLTLMSFQTGMTFFLHRSDKTYRTCQLLLVGVCQSSIN